jgi:hypothetical protein
MLADQQERSARLPFRGSLICSRRPAEAAVGRCQPPPGPAGRPRLPRNPDQIRAVRADLRALLGDSPIADDVILCASELAANAALHSRSRKPAIPQRAQDDPTRCERSAFVMDRQ